MPPKLRAVVYVVVILVLAFALLLFGLTSLPASYALLWIIFVAIVCGGALQRMFGRPASDPEPRPNNHRLTRSRRHYWIAGVCGGIAEFLGWQPGIVRALWLLFSLLFVGIGGVLIYIIMALAMPLPPDRGGKFRLDDFRVQ